LIPESFHFLRPAWLLALLLLLPIGWAALRRARGIGAWDRVCDPHLLRHLVAESGGRAAHWPLALLALGWLGACLALAGPAFERLPQTSFREPSRTVFVLGLGDSMNQRDVRPSRLARARHKLLDALDRAAGGSVALVVYKEEAFAVTPLTDDADVLREAIPQLETRLMPGRRVSVARGIEEARRLLEPHGLRSAQIVLVSDGADDSPKETLAAVRDVAGEGARVSVVALAGESEALAELARQGGGAFAALAIDDTDLDRVFDAAGGLDPARGAALVKSEATTDEWNDLGRWLVWIPLLLAPLAFRRGWAGSALLLLCLQLSSAPAQAGVADAFQRPDQRGARAFDEGRFAESAQHFEDPAWQAAARYRAGDFAGAAKTLTALPEPGPQYNLGNALAKSGKLEEAIAAYERALAAQADDEDVRFNRDLVKKLLEEQKKQEQDPKQEQQASHSDDSQDGQPDAKQDASETKHDASQPQSQNRAQDEPSEAQDAQPADSAAGEPGEAASENAAPGSESPDPGRQDETESAAGDRPAQAQPAPAGEPQGEQVGERPAEDAGETARAAGTATAPRRPVSAEEQERAQLMARLPDDPGGLLREKIRRDYLRKQAARSGEE
jgi:Ca-activated chloride channel family protein